MMNKKYEFVEGDTLTLTDGAVLHRIRAVRDIPEEDVKAGDLGGYIETESNLPHDDSSWVFPGAHVIGKDSTVRNSTVWDSTVEDSTVDDSTVEDSWVRDGVIIDGETIEFIKKRASAWKKEGV